MKKLLAVVAVLIMAILLSGCNVGKAVVNIHTVPEDASVSIDGNTITGNYIKGYQVSPGTHEIVVSKKGYEAVKKEISVKMGECLNIEITLKKIPDKAKVVIKTNNNFTVVIDGHCIGNPPDKPIFVKKGIHTIQLINEPGGTNKPYSLIGKFDIEKDTVLTEKDFEKEPPQSAGGIFFPVTFTSPVPLMRCCSVAAITYSGIYANETVDLKGYTLPKIKTFFVVFPSGKKVEIKTDAGGNCDCCVNRFEKKVTFDEIGEYFIKTGEMPSYEHFYVFYKPEIVSPVKTVKELFPFINNYMNDAIVVIEGKTQKLRLLLKDAKGDIVRNKPIGKYGLKTDSNGIVSVNLTGFLPMKDTLFGCCGEVLVNGKEAPVLIYAGIKANVVRKIVISKKYAKEIKGNIYVPEKMILPCLLGLPKDITVNGERYVNITEMINHPELFAGRTVRESKNAFVVYELADMVP